MGVGDWFSSFCGNITVQDDGTISQRYRAITRRLNTDFWNTTSETAHSLYAGSYGRNTAIHGFSDLDMIIELPFAVYQQYNRHVGNGQSALLQSVKASIEQTYSKTSLRADGQVIQVPFTDGITFEVVPGFLDDIIALLNRNPAHAQGAELVRRFVEQVYIPQKYENGDWRRATGQEAEYLFRRSIVPEIGELRCRDLKAEHLRAVLRELAGTGLSYESVSKVRFAMGDMVKRMVAEEYLTSNIASGLKTPKTAKRSDRSRLRRVTLAEYLRAWTVLDERERLAFDLVTFCGLRESEVYGLRNGDLFQQGAIRVERSWYKGDINPTKTDEIREVGVGAEIFERLITWIATLPEGNHQGWVFPSERIVTPLLPDNVLRRCIHPRLEPLGLDWINFAVLRRSHSTLHQERGTDPKIIADQQGHGLGVHLSDYVDSSVARKRAAVAALWSDFKALKSEPSAPN